MAPLVLRSFIETLSETAASAESPVAKRCPPITIERKNRTTSDASLSTVETSMRKLVDFLAKKIVI